MLCAAAEYTGPESYNCRCGHSTVGVVTALWVWSLHCGCGHSTVYTVKRVVIRYCMETLPITSPYAVLYILCTRFFYLVVGVVSALWVWSPLSVVLVCNKTVQVFFLYVGGGVGKCCVHCADRLPQGRKEQ